MSTARKLPKEAVAAAVVVGGLGLMAAGWLLLSGNHKELSQVAHVPGPERSKSSTAPVQTRVGHLPPGLADKQLALGAGVSPAEVRRVAGGKSQPASQRLLALKRLERQGDPQFVRLALQIVGEAGKAKEQRLLAVNALGVLSRSAEGRKALARLARSAPDLEIRRAAQTLLARKR